MASSVILFISVYLRFYVPSYSYTNPLDTPTSFVGVQNIQNIDPYNDTLPLCECVRLTVATFYVPYVCVTLAYPTVHK